MRFFKTCFLFYCLLSRAPYLHGAEFSCETVVGWLSAATHFGGWKLESQAAGSVRILNDPAKDLAIRLVASEETTAWIEEGQRSRVLFVPEQLSESPATVKPLVRQLLTGHPSNPFNQKDLNQESLEAYYQEGWGETLEELQKIFRLNSDRSLYIDPSPNRSQWMIRNLLSKAVEEKPGTYLLVVPFEDQVAVFQADLSALGLSVFLWNEERLSTATGVVIVSSSQMAAFARGVKASEANAFYEGLSGAIISQVGVRNSLDVANFLRLGQVNRNFPLMGFADRPLQTTRTVRSPFTRLHWSYLSPHTQFGISALIDQAHEAMLEGELVSFEKLHVITAESLGVDRLYIPTRNGSRKQINPEHFPKLMERYRPLLLLHRQALVTVNSIEEADRVLQAMTRAIPEKRGAVFHSKVDKAVRDQTLQDYQDGKIDYLVGVQMFDDHYTRPEASLVIDLTHQTNPKALLSRIINSMRVYEGKTEVDVVTTFEMDSRQHREALVLFDALRDSKLSASIRAYQSVNNEELQELPWEEIKRLRNQADLEMQALSSSALDYWKESEPTQAVAYQIFRWMDGHLSEKDLEIELREYFRTHSFDVLVAEVKREARREGRSIPESIVSRLEAIKREADLLQKRQEEKQRERTRLKNIATRILRENKSFAEWIEESNAAALAQPPSQNLRDTAERVFAQYGLRPLEIKRLALGEDIQSITERNLFSLSALGFVNGLEPDLAFLSSMDYSLGDNPESDQKDLEILSSWINVRTNVQKFFTLRSAIRNGDVFNSRGPWNGKYFELTPEMENEIDAVYLRSNAPVLYEFIKRHRLLDRSIDDWKNDREGRAEFLRLLRSDANSETSGTFLGFGRDNSLVSFLKDAHLALSRLSTYPTDPLSLLIYDLVVFTYRDHFTSRFPVISRFLEKIESEAPAITDEELVKLASQKALADAEFLEELQQYTRDFQFSEDLGQPLGLTRILAFQVLDGVREAKHQEQREHHRSRRRDRASQAKTVAIESGTTISLAPTLGQEPVDLYSRDLLRQKFPEILKVFDAYQAESLKARVWYDLLMQDPTKAEVELMAVRGFRWKGFSTSERLLLEYVVARFMNENVAR